jgi:hypothetical protein
MCCGSLGQVIGERVSLRIDWKSALHISLLDSYTLRQADQTLTPAELMSW